MLGKLYEVVKSGDGFYTEDGDRIYVDSEDLEGLEGDKQEVFVYKYEDGRYLGTTKKPKILLGEIKALEVLDRLEFGAFLDWGMIDDLLLPRSHMLFDPLVGREYLVKLEEGQDKLYATMEIRNSLLADSDYDSNDWVEGWVYSKNDDFGVFVAVDGKYDAMIANENLFTDLDIGETVKARVINKSEGGKLNLTLEEQSYIAMDDDAALIKDVLEKSGGFIPYNDKSPADEIRETFAMSKKAFKRATGRLYRERVIEFTEDGIKLLR